MKPEDLRKVRAGDEYTLQFPEGRWKGLCSGRVYMVKADKHGQHYFENDTNEEIWITPIMMTYMEPFIQKRGGWIGVDLDGTLAVYDRWRGPYHIGEPLQPMVDRIKDWIAQGRDVRIFTARVTEKDKNEDGTPHDLTTVRNAITVWCLKHIGLPLPITNVKDWSMIELWDDRAVQMVPNTGRTLAEEHEAIRSADAGKAAGAAQ